MNVYRQSNGTYMVVDLGVLKGIIDHNRYKVVRGIVEDNGSITHSHKTVTQFVLVDGSVLTSLLLARDEVPGHVGMREPITKLADGLYADGMRRHVDLDGLRIDIVVGLVGDVIHVWEGIDILVPQENDIYVRVKSHLEVKSDGFSYGDDDFDYEDVVKGLIKTFAIGEDK